MASRDPDKPTPSQRVLLWERVTAENRGSVSVLGSGSHLKLVRWASERAIPTRDWMQMEDLIVLLALWEFKLPQDDPLATVLRPLVNLTRDEIRERVDFNSHPYYTRADIIEALIHHKLDRRRHTAGQPAQQPQQTQQLPDTDREDWLCMTLIELRGAISRRHIPWVQDEWKMQWRGPLTAHLLIAEVVAEGNLQQDPTVYKMLLPGVLDKVAECGWYTDTCAIKKTVYDQACRAYPSLLRPVSPPPTTRNPAPHTAPGPSGAAQTATQAVVPMKRAHTESGGSSSSLMRDVTDGPPPAKRRTLPWNSDTTQPQPQPKPRPEPREGFFSMTPSQLWEELDNRGIPHATDGKKTTNKVQLVARLLLHEAGAEPGEMFDRLLPDLEQVFGRGYAGMRAWARRRNVSVIGLPSENREPLAKCIVQRVVEREVARVEAANRMAVLLNPMARLAFAQRGVGTNGREGS